MENLEKSFEKSISRPGEVVENKKNAESHGKIMKNENGVSNNLMTI